MSLTIEELIISAKKLANRLKDDESTADALINHSKHSHSKIECIKQYSEDIEKINEAASQRPHSVLIAGLQKETQHLRELQAENSDLHSALRDHQNTIELIMSRYREQISQLMSQNKVDLSVLHNMPQCTKIIMDQYAQINRMREIMRQAAQADEESSIKDQELISQLMIENKGLREMLNINRKYNFQQPTLENQEVEVEKPVDKPVNPLLDEI